MKYSQCCWLVVSAFGWAGGAALAGPSTWTPVNGVTPSAGFVVDATNRMESLSFYNGAFLPSEGAAARLQWTGNYVGCTPGTTSPDFRKDVQRRVNYYRALVGLPADITFDAESVFNSGKPGSPQVSGSVSKQWCAQSAAHMNAFSSVFFEGFVISHDPLAADTACWTAAAWNGCQQSNLTLGFFGPKAVDVYMADDNVSDDLSNNSNVGHRRWMLYSRARDMSTGDVPPGVYQDVSGSYPVLPSNALYIASNFLTEEAGPKQFVSWPPRGYVPGALLPLRWSLSFPKAVFSAAASSITMTGPTGAAIPVTVLSFDNTKLGDNTMVFQPATLPVPGAADVSYTVRVTGMSGVGVPTSYQWTTTFFDPTVLGVAQSITGPAQPAASGGDYLCSDVALASSYQMKADTRGVAGTYLENGDAPVPLVTSDKTGTYPLLQAAAVFEGLNFFPRSAPKSFHLCFPPDESEVDYLPHNQSFSLDAEFIPAADSVLTFHEVFRWLFTNNRLSAEISSDGGNQWTEVYGRNGSYTYSVGGNYSSTGWDTTWMARTVALAAWAGKPIRLRFILRPGAVSFDGGDTNHGCYIDDISLSNVQRLTPLNSIAQTSPAFRFDSQLVGGPLVSGTTYLLRARPQVGGRYMGYSNPLALVPKPPTGFEAAYPSLGALPQGDADGDSLVNLLEYAFGLNPLVPTPSSSLPQPTLSAAGLNVKFNVPSGITDIDYLAERTSDFAAWQAMTNLGTATQPSFTLPVVVGQKSFLRLRVRQR